MLRVENLSFAYGSLPVLQDIAFSVPPGENVAIIGESGSGKSTLLNCIHGKFDLDKGSVKWKEHTILGPAYNLIEEHDFMKYVPQEYDLMPFTTVEENVGKFLSNMYPEKKRARVKELLRVVELDSFSKTKVKNLSGGQRQRVALAKALAYEPEILLLDEPFSHIDNFKKHSLRRKVFQFLKANDISCIVASHDRDDILGFADKMIVLEEGEIVANDSVERLYTDPPTPLVASFFGEFNVLNSAVVSGSNSTNHDLILYASQLKVVDNSALCVKVKASYFQGDNYLISASYLEDEVLFYHPQRLKAGSRVCLDMKPQSDFGTI